MVDVHYSKVEKEYIISVHDVFISKENKGVKLKNMFLNMLKSHYYFLTTDYFEKKNH